MALTEASVHNVERAAPTCCFLCGSQDIVITQYLRLNSRSVARNLAYALPQWMAALLCKASKAFNQAYRPVQVNREYFDRLAAYCRCCSTGWVSPEFDERELAEYYRNFYWSNRDSVDGQHVPLEDRPNQCQRSLASDRILWLKAHGATYQSVIDLGAGDCAATYQFIEDGVAWAHVVDPSQRAEALSRKYGASHSTDMRGAAMADLVFSAHSVEHVANLPRTLAEIAAKTSTGGYVFFETPNIADVDVFLGLCHTPHTFMLSESSFRAAIRGLPLQVVATEVCGPTWSTNYPRIKSSARTDLRILLRKLGGRESQPL